MKEKDSHIFVDGGMFMSIDSGKFYSAKCKYCGYSTLKNITGEYLFFNNKKCLTDDEKIIKDLLE